MIVDISVPFVDTSADDLRFMFAAPKTHVLDELRLTDVVPGGVLTLRVLGASHQAVFETDDGTYEETVACLPNEGTPLPSKAETIIGNRQFGFCSQIETFSPRDFTARCSALRSRALSFSESTLLGQFPGEKDALTVLEAANDQLNGMAGWVTTHCYPSERQIVVTTTKITHRGN
ncbi:MAG TPA: DUF2617 family protein [Candidatus Stackebrandtia faecavium]|nr:DUF2617 family protein [Candidatus Stackebrandtia faecavium]